MQTNRKTPSLNTHEGAPSKHINPAAQLRRSVMSCMLWEKEFYESGQTIAERIATLIPHVAPETVAALAIEAREKMKLRHIPLFLVREMARLPAYKGLVAATLSRVIQRPDELTEFVSLYWKDKKQPLSAQVKKGLARAFPKFNEYSLAKYNRDHAVKLRDVLFLCHAIPQTAEQAMTWKRLVDNDLMTPDTWEVALSAAQDKKVEWTRLVKENKLGALALLRNLRNLKEVGVDQKLVQKAIASLKTERVLPYRFIAAARYAPDLESDLESAMFKCVQGTEKLPGSTCLLVDVSGSMDQKLSEKSDLSRLDAACGLAMLLRETCDQLAVRTFSARIALIPNRRGFALRDSITMSQAHSSTELGEAIRFLKDSEPHYDRLIVLTDEQSSDRVSDPIWPHSYVINVASAKNGIGYGPWTHVDGFSEAVVDYIREFECNKFSGE